MVMAAILLVERTDGVPATSPTKHPVKGYSNYLRCVCLLLLSIVHTQSAFYL